MSRARRFALALLTGSLAISASPALAAGFQAKTMREPLSTREVERPLVIGRGWLELGLGTDVKTATTYWDPEGEVAEMDGTTWTWSQARADMRYGITRRGELYASLKWNFARIENESLGTDTFQHGFGDPRFGYKYELFRGVAPLTSIVAHAEYKAPAANESPGNGVGGPTTFQSIVMTTGTPDGELGVHIKRQLGPFALTVGGAYVRRFSGVVQWLVDTEYYQFNGRLKPGDIKKVDGELILQTGPVALFGGSVVQVRDDVRIGSSTGGLFPAKDLPVVEGSGGWQWDAWTGAILHASRGVDLVGKATLPLRGEDLLYFPIEDLHPTRGITWSGAVELRY